MIQLLIGMLIFAFFAIAGLVVDLGFARLAQRQMATASDSAALEGMRLKDAATDDARRASARDALIAHFDDDFGVTAGDTLMQGAGPLLTLSGGQTSMLACQTLGVAPSVVYKPDPQLNLPNARQGDMVGGWFDEQDLDHVETATYERSDFTTVEDPTLREAFLVRLRRTRDALGLDQQTGVSSAGPTLPYLFGRGSMIDAKPRQDGITVRSTSVAAARFGTTVGPDDPARGLVGASIFALEFDYWQSLPINTDTVIRFGGNTGGPSGGANPFPPGHGGTVPPGQWIPPGQLVGGGGVPLGFFLNRPAHLTETGRNAWSIGDDAPYDVTLSEAQILALLGNPQADGYVPRIWFVPVYNGDMTLGWDGTPGLKWDNLLGPRLVGFGTLLVISATTEPVNNGNGNGNGNNGNGNGNGNGNNGNGNNGNGNGNGNNSLPPGTENLRLLVRKLPGFVAASNVSSVEAPGLAGIPDPRTILDKWAVLDGSVRAAAIVR